MRVALFMMPLAFAAAAGAQTIEPKSFLKVEQHAIRSSVNHLDYRLFVSLPPGYSANDTTRYPVLYALDGNYSFQLIQAVSGYLQQGSAIPRIIIVGVGYPDSSNADIRRRMDLTPSSDLKQDSLERRVYLKPGDTTSKLPSGGAPAFLKTLRDDLIPLIERKYHTSSDRALVGHSFGGLFTLYTLYTAPELFERYGIFSPATWWSQQRLLDQISKVKLPRGPVAARVVVAVGADEDAGMRAEADSVSILLKRVYGAQLTLMSRRNPGNHVSYFPEALSPGLAFLYPNGGCLNRTSGTGKFFTVLSGPDRVATERFTRNGNDVSGEVFQNLRCISYELNLDAGGRVAAARLAEPGPSGTRTVRGELNGSRVQFKTTEPAQESSFDAAQPTALYVPLIIASLDQLVRQSPFRVGDSTRVLMANFRHADTTTGVITRVSANSIRVRHPNVEILVRISDRLEILGGTTTPTAPGSAGLQWVLVRQP